MRSDVDYKTRKLIRMGDLNSRSSLHGGRLLEWVDEECGIYAMCELETRQVVTKLMSEVNFISPARIGDIIEIVLETVSFGTTSIVIKVEVRNKDTMRSILTLDKVVMVSVDENGRPKPHGKTSQGNLNKD